MSKETIAGDIRRIRKILKPYKNGQVIVDYGKLLILFDKIETKAKILEEK